jgi:hypothetical protein
VTTGGQWQQGQPQDWPGQYGPPGYGQPPYSQQPPYGQPAYPPPGYVPGWAPQPQLQPHAWPHGPRRPGTATAAAVLGIVTGSLTTIGGFGFLVGGLTGDGDLSTWLLSLGLPAGGLLLAGGIRLLGRRSAELVLWSAVAAAVLVVLALLGGIATLADDDLDGVLGFTVFALPLPVVTAALAGQRTVRDWVTAGRFRG